MHSDTQMFSKLAQAHQAFAQAEHTFAQRQSLLANMAAIMQQKLNFYSQCITQQMHKPMAQSRAEIEKCIRLLRYFADLENPMLPQNIATEFSISQVHHMPMGVVLGIMPWNFPFWQVLRFCVPAVLAGNAVLIKHADICFASAQLIEDLFEESGFPPGICLSLEIDHAQCAQLIAQPLLRGISLTGSEQAGRTVAQLAGQSLKKCVLELGGNDAFIVLQEANLPQAAQAGALARLQNCGQTCIAAKRFIVQSSVFDDFMSHFITEYQTYQYSDPFDDNCRLSRMARPDLAQKLQDQYQLALAHGAEIIIPLEALPNDIFKPGILKVSTDNPILEQEVFGPLALVLSADTDAEILQLANATSYGLGNSVWSQDLSQAKAMALQLESGLVAINKMTKSDIRMPFNGVKNSGYGIELSQLALFEFCYKKSMIG
jgi:succinate-semialdehyde dehydrogenase / glutarate-semialdehyde dehydrogenase